jgi:type IV pili sensor histidine kinase/response regulator
MGPVRDPIAKVNGRTQPPYRHALGVALVSVVLLGAAAPVCVGELAVARYSTFPAGPTIAQRDPLQALIRMTFPPSVTRVGEAIDALLASSGFRLAAAETASPQRKGLLELPLPEVHRALGPMPLRGALETLAGPSFILVEDPAHRLVSFEPGARTAGD